MGQEYNTSTDKLKSAKVQRSEKILQKGGQTTNAASGLAGTVVLWYTLDLNHLIQDKFVLMPTFRNNL